jgi:hypothetical protein
MIYRGPGFLEVVLFGSSPTSLAPSPVGNRYQSSLMTERGGEKGVSEEPNPTSARKPGPL